MCQYPAVRIRAFLWGFGVYICCWRFFYVPDFTGLKLRSWKS
jgi:hypothetical protein